jgi:hypothetical protein
VDVPRAFTRLELRLTPCLLRAAGQAQAEGPPMTRAMVAEFPDDPARTHLERRYVFGDDLLGGVGDAASVEGGTAPASRGCSSKHRGPRW